MKYRLLFLLLLASFLPLQAQTGETAAATVQLAKSNGWQNWAFAALALVTASAAVVIVGLNQGHRAHDH